MKSSRPFSLCSHHQGDRNQSCHTLITQHRPHTCPKCSHNRPLRGALFFYWLLITQVMHESVLLLWSWNSADKTKDSFELRPQGQPLGLLQALLPAAADTWLVALEAAGEWKPQRATSCGKTLVLSESKKGSKRGFKEVFIPWRTHWYQLPLGKGIGWLGDTERRGTFHFLTFCRLFEFWPWTCIPYSKQYI